MIKKIDVLIIGAGAAGLMCAIEAGKRGRHVLILDHANKAGKKILMSGGGRCNFTNLHIDPNNYLSHNPNFCKSALSRYTQWNFIELVKQYQIPYHEKTLGQLFCDNKSKDILELLLTECTKAKVNLQLNTDIHLLQKNHDDSFLIKTSHGNVQAQSVVIASGGLSIPTMGASPFAYKIAEQFAVKVWPTSAGLVPLTLQVTDKEKLATLTGISVDSLVSNTHISFRENMLFTHRGLSGPAILQQSSYWQSGESISIDLLPDLNLTNYLKSMQQQAPHKILKSVLALHLPKRLLEIFLNPLLLEKKLADTSHRHFEQISHLLKSWQIKPNGTEGYRTAEVTLGGIDTTALSSKTMQVNQIAGLYFIGEALDVTGWLGGFNFQWAWSSGWAAGQVV